MDFLLQHRSNVTSQFGEDGIIDAIFNRLGIGVGHCVEFGAWDGTRFSNTWNLWHNSNWGAVLIEGDAKKAEALSQNVEDHPHVTAICSYISHQGSTTLDAVLKQTCTPAVFELLSIDVDGNEYHIWQSVRDYRASLVIVEYNPTIPPHVEFIDKPGCYGMGSSAASLVALANRKGYELVCCTTASLFFLEKESVPQLGLQTTSLSDLFVPDCLTYVVSSYAGNTILMTHDPSKREPTYVSTSTMRGIRQQLTPLQGRCPEGARPALVLTGHALRRLFPLITVLCRTQQIVSRALRALSGLVSVFLPRRLLRRSKGA